MALARVLIRHNDNRMQHVSVVDFLTACLVSEILKAKKKDKVTSHPLFVHSKAS